MACRGSNSGGYRGSGEVMAQLSYPRIPTQVAIGILREFDGKPLSDFSDAAATEHLRSFFHPNYPYQVESSLLETIREGVVSIALKHGFPAELRSQSSAGDFDRETAVFLVENMNILPVEASVEEVWNFFTLVLLPDVGVWRYPYKPGDYEYARLIGKPRNVFRKLWWRAYVLGPELSNKLGEDETVNIMERPSVGGNRALARAIVRAHSRVRSEFEGRFASSEFLRTAMVQIRAINAVRGLTFLPEEGLQAEIDEVFNGVRDAYIRAVASGDATTGRHLRRLIASGEFG